MARRICGPSGQLGLEFSILWGIERGGLGDRTGAADRGALTLDFDRRLTQLGRPSLALRCRQLRVVIFVTAVPSVQSKELNNGTITCRQFLASGQANMAALISWLRGGFRRARSVASLAASTNSTAHTRSCSITSGSVANFERALHRLHSE